MEQIFKTGWCVIGICLIWQGLELLIYGEIQDRVVDNIIMFLLIPIIYRAMR